ncbi:MAG: RagB/SusD family nutrient uptake outer membrane protein [Bacteroidales bacterium]|nr:RagB/SusD family nutrient uptake outer membrane protein [Bacteroidales bacterium]MBR2228555.1 RagB/SusD family nutrient uptake outer membrane protein [Bacteroidales bacterium]
MKKILYILSAAVIAATAVSCEKFLDTKSPSTFDSATVYSNYSLTENTIFSIAQSFGETNNYRGRYLSWIGLNSDIEWYNTYKPTDEKYQIAAYSQLPNNGQLNLNNGPFAKMYEAIERANLCIEGIREYGSPETDKDMAYLLGEVLTLRAMIYYDLVRAWGDVPARFESTTSETIYKEKVSRDEIFKQLLADLDEAIPYLPYPGANATTSRTDRVNKLFAEGLYARIALMASGYAQRPDDGMVGTGDLGTNRMTNDPDLQKSVLYPKALAYLEDAINSGSASLEDFEDMWKKQSNQDNLVAGPGSETLFVIPFSDGRGRWNYTFAVRSEGSSYAGGANVTRGGDAGPVPTMWFKYDPNDIRRDITCVNWRWNSDDEQELVGIQKWYFGKYRWEWLTRNPYKGGNDDGIKPVVLRYADILLMAAEIANEQDDLAKAKSYLLPVRERAFKGHEDQAETYVERISSKDAMFDAIVDERAFEFCGEMTRKFDLIRWGILKEKLDQAIAEMKDLRDLKGRFAGVNMLGGDVYYRLDGNKLVIYGFNGEAVKPAGAWEKKSEYFTKVVDSKGADTGLYDALVEGIYDRDPEQYMFWPIYFDTMTNSQGMIQNDYGYESN